MKIVNIIDGVTVFVPKHPKHKGLDIKGSLGRMLASRRLAKEFKIEDFAYDFMDLDSCYASIRCCIKRYYNGKLTASKRVDPETRAKDIYIIVKEE